MRSHQAALRSLIVISIIIACTAVTSAQSAYLTIVNNGDPRTRSDIVFLGDGYTAAEMNDYHSDIQACVKYMFSQEPFKEYQRYINIHRIDVVSAESGIDHPAAAGDGSCGYYPDFYHTPKAGTCKNTALDASYGTDGPYQQPLTVNTTKVNNIVEPSLLPSQRDIVVVIVNDPYPGGGTGGVIPVISRWYRNGYMAYWGSVLHELGHRLAQLGDEYTVLGATSVLAVSTVVIHPISRQPRMSFRTDLTILARHCT